MPATILICDDYEMIRRAIKALLDGQGDMLVVGEATNLEEVLRLTSELKPTVIVLDLHLGNAGTAIDPIEVKSLLAGSYLIAVSIWDDDETKLLASSYGAAETIDKTSLATDLVSAIRKCIGTANTWVN